METNTIACDTFSPCVGNYACCVHAETTVGTMEHARATRAAIMSNGDFIAALIARRDALAARYEGLIVAGDTFAADDMLSELQFSIRAAHDALMGR